uniref:ABC multidrug transporter n=1 Tax=Colletotrichum fructicola (strain Nara gc5) TaxID=1213859 RepID=L2GBK3_COLFN
MAKKNQTDEKSPPAGKGDAGPVERKPAFADYIRVFTYASRWDFIVYVIAAVASLGAGVTLPLMNILFGQLVGQFTEFFQPNSTLTTSDFEHLLNRQALLIMALFLGRWLLNSINKFCFRMIGIRLSSAIGISERLGTFLQFTGTILTALIIAFIWSWDLTLVTSSLLLYITLILAIVLPRVVKGQTETLVADMQGTAVASEALGGIRLVMACGAQKRKTAPIVAAQFGLIFFGMFGAYGLAFWYGTQRFIAGALNNAGVVFVVLMSVMMILTSMERISTPLMAVSKAMVAACELFTVIDAPLPPSGNLKPEIDSHDIIFEDVVFGYPTRPGITVLNELNFRIHPGENIALVGPSGSGKSTIVGLLERWYSLREQPAVPKVNLMPQAAGKAAGEKVPEVTRPSGRIRVGGVDLEDCDLQWWRSQVGLVQQEPFLFNDTIFGNVANGLIGTGLENESEERRRQLVQDACEEAYAHEFICRLPDGYDTKVGDGGAKLSGGQKQRLAIARSIIKQPRIIILDEATSAIDAKSEKVVQAALDRVTKGRTTITIAHRLSTIQKADHIVVLQQGQAVEQGTHQSLMANKYGVYRGLVNAQALNLSDPNDEKANPKLVEFDDASTEKTYANSSKHGGPPSILSDREVVKRKPRGIIWSFGKLMWIQRDKWPSYLGITISAMAVASGTPIQAWLFAKVINVFLLPSDELKKEANFWGLMWMVLAICIGIAWACEGWIGLHTQYFISAVYKKQYLTDMLHQNVSFFDDDENSHGALSSRVGGDAKQLEELLGLNLALLLSGLFTVAGAVLIALLYSPKLGLIAMFVCLPVMLGTGLWKYRQEVQFDQMNSTVFMESSQFATEAIGAIRTVSALTMEPSIKERYEKLLNQHIDAAKRKAQWTSVLYGFADSAGMGCQALVFWYGGRLLAKGEYTMEAFFICLMAIIQGAESASGVRIELRDVHFKYPTRDVVVFDGLNLTIEKGQYAAFVGPSGCGKTTIISLLERFYDVEPNRGEVLCNGINVNHMNVYNYRRNLSLVPQEPIMFRGTIRDNVLFGISEPALISEQRIHDACREAFIHDFIASLPEGYDTQVGQKGVSMSGGQKQRIAIARALIRDPKLLLLDEATSALDSESEKIVQAAFERARQGRTMVAVAHRLATIQTADVIFVFSEGCVVEKGTHKELLRKKGVYWEMCQSQALDQ